MLIVSGSLVLGDRIFVLEVHTAVSYTHLDVYKRQVMTVVLSLELSSPVVTLEMKGLLLAMS